MSSIKVVGGQSLNGTVTPIPNKNAILPSLAACVLTSDTVTYKNVPDTSDVKKMLQIIRGFGGTVNDENYDNLQVTCSNLHTQSIDPELASSLRTSFLYVGPLLARFGYAKISLPGGCDLGARSVAAHIEAFSKAGVRISYEGSFVMFELSKNFKAANFIWLSETSVTATENLAMFLAGIDCETTVVNAACEPHVVQLCEMLKNMGASIDGIGSNRLLIKGTSSLAGTTFIPKPDVVDIGGYIVAAAVTKGKIIIKGGADMDTSGGIVNTFSKFNIGFETKDTDLVVDGTRNLQIDLNTSGFPLAGDALPKITPQPWPGFPVDVLPALVTLACKLNGKLFINNWMYETGLEFARSLNTLGANINILDSQRIVTNGPVHFKGGEVTAPVVIQGCKAIYLAALADNAETIIHGTDVLKRRYPNIFEIYASLGAHISQV